CWNGQAVNKPHYDPTDKQTRATGAEVCLQGTLTDGGDGRCTPRGFNDDTDNRGHLIGQRLGGNGLASDRPPFTTGAGYCQNIVPLERVTNRDTMKLGPETLVAQLVQSGQTVYYSVTPLYLDGTQAAPTALAIVIATPEGAIGFFLPNPTPSAAPGTLP